MKLPMVTALLLCYTCSASILNPAAPQNDQVKREMYAPLEDPQQSFKPNQVKEEFHTPQEDAQETIDNIYAETYAQEQVRKELHALLEDPQQSFKPNQVKEEFYEDMDKVKEELYTPTVETQDPTQFSNVWPDGTYSLPKPRNGCPAHGQQFGQWYEGWRYQDTEDFRNRNRFSRGHHLEGSFGRNIKTWWCSKNVTSGDYGITWPKGSYCIGKKNGQCPNGFSEGYIKWDDEDINNNNRRGGILPDGVYNRNTIIYYCCRNDALPTNPITLPTDRPFYLMQKHRDGCQHVRNMQVQAEWVYWDDEDFNNSDSESGSYPYRGGATNRNQRLNYCYYY